MNAFRTLVTSLLIGALALGAGAQTIPGSRDAAPVRIVSATVKQFDPPVRTRKGPYKQALVLQLAITDDEFDSLPQAMETYFYIGTHELHPFATEAGKEGVILTFHDPDWQKLEGGEPMVLTARQGDPLVHPKNYEDAPRFDPKIIH
jgi:hypothetical protein